MGTWTVTCPNQGTYAGEGHYVKKGEKFELHLKKVVTIKKPHGETCEAEKANPRTRAFLPHVLTRCERASERVQRKLSGCIKSVEMKCCGKHTTDYSDCECNPIAVCRATVSCP